MNKLIVTKTIFCFEVELQLEIEKEFEVRSTHFEIPLGFSILNSTPGHVKQYFTSKRYEEIFELVKNERGNYESTHIEEFESTL